MLFDRSQLMRGTLEGCILKIISRETTYGYEIIEYLRGSGFSDVSEGTIYPLLLRLEKQSIISSELRSSPLGPKRKYYTITDYGRQYLNEFTDCWINLNKAAAEIIVKEAPHDEQRVKDSRVEA
ncbi:MAG: PadR family transcriptional regulator [Eubacteriales bacterium]